MVHKAEAYVQDKLLLPNPLKPFCKLLVRSPFVAWVGVMGLKKVVIVHITLSNDTIGKFFLQHIFVHICLPQSLIDVKKFAAVLVLAAM